MTTELIGIIVTLLLTILLAVLLGKYISKVFKDEKTITDFIKPLERFIFRSCGIDPKKEMNWKEHLAALLSINMIWFLYAFIILITQGSLFLNPDGNASQTPDLAFNTAISFLVNCNLQHYSGESGVTYLSQLGVLAFLQFVSAATGVAAVLILFRALVNKTTTQLGNFFVFLTKTITRVFFRSVLSLPCCCLLMALPPASMAKTGL